MSLVSITSFSLFSKSERNRASSPAFVLLSLLRAAIAWPKTQQSQIKGKMQTLMHFMQKKQWCCSAAWVSVPLWPQRYARHWCTESHHTGSLHCSASGSLHQRDQPHGRSETKTHVWIQGCWRPGQRLLCSIVHLQHWPVWAWALWPSRSDDSVRSGAQSCSSEPAGWVLKPAGHDSGFPHTPRSALCTKTLHLVFYDTFHLFSIFSFIFERIFLNLINAHTHLWCICTAAALLHINILF